MKFYELPEDVTGTVFDPKNTTFGPIMRDIQTGDFETAALRLRNLTSEHGRRRIYKSEQNLNRAARGEGLIVSHPDFGRMADNEREFLTAASDTIADILHALNARGYFRDELTDAYSLLEQASRGYDGELEDELPFTYEDEPS